ncbi:hypothetical protein [Myxococcus hansupus]|uniref:hypothetical protein n=1 Tax=Pseudomyxococcus hansupus TaxID=1297742 RepID=UPI000A9E3216
MCRWGENLERKPIRASLGLSYGARKNVPGWIAVHEFDLDAQGDLSEDRRHFLVQIGASFPIEYRKDSFSEMMQCALTGEQVIQHEVCDLVSHGESLLGFSVPGVMEEERRARPCDHAPIQFALGTRNGPTNASEQNPIQDVSGRQSRNGNKFHVQPFFCLCGNVPRKRREVLHPTEGHGFIQPMTNQGMFSSS